MPKAPKKTEAPSLDALEGVVESTSPDAATAVAERPAAKKPDAKPAKKAKRNPVAEMKARMFNSKAPEKKPAKEEKAAAVKPKQTRRQEPVEQVDDEEEEEFEDDPIVDETDDEDDEQDETPARRGVADRRDSRTAELDDKTFDSGEELGYSRKDMRELLDEMGSVTAVKKFLDLSKSKLRRPAADDREDTRSRRPAERERETEQEEQHDDSDPSKLRKELDALFAKLELSDIDDLGETGLKLAERLAARHDGQGKAIAKMLERFEKKLDALETTNRNRAIAEQNQQFDDCIKKLPPEWADVYGKVRTHKLPAGSGLREARNKLAQKMFELQQDRVADGDPLDMNELMDEALDLLHKDRLKTKAKQELEREQSNVRGTKLLRPNSRSGKLAPGPEKLRRNIGARFAKLGL